MKKFAFTSTEGATHVGIFGNSRKIAFTLAEVLITLGIIGVVAALTLPALINNYQKKQTVTRLQKAFSILSEAVKRSEVEHGETKYWDFTLSGTDFYNIYLKKYVSKTGATTLENYPKKIAYKALNPELETSSRTFLNDKTLIVQLADGILLYITGERPQSALGDYISVGIDVNGFQNPNQFGKDAFFLQISPVYGVHPHGANPSLSESYGEFDRDTLINANRYLACNKEKEGHWCAALIMGDGWQIKKDYPW